MNRNTWKDFLHILKVFQLTIKSAVVMTSTLVSRAFSISLKKTANFLYRNFAVSANFCGIQIADCS